MSSNRLVQILNIICVLVVWEMAAYTKLIDVYFFPSPSVILTSFPTIYIETLQTFSKTFLKSIVAFLISASLGIGIGILIGSMKYLYEIFNLYLVALYSVPKIVFLPILFFLFGMSEVAVIFFATLHASIPLILLTVGAVKDVDKSLVTIARSFGASTTEIYWKVILPSVVPAVFSATRTVMIFSFLGVIIGEMFFGVIDTGGLMRRLAYTFKNADLFAVSIIIATIISIMLHFLARIEKKFSLWREV